MCFEHWFNHAVGEVVEIECTANAVSQFLAAASMNAFLRESLM
jgi:hypothetical protein